jgi:hypothetical protein
MTEDGPELVKYAQNHVVLDCNNYVLERVYVVRTHTVA